MSRPYKVFYNYQSSITDIITCTSRLMLQMMRKMASPILPLNLKRDAFDKTKFLQ